MPTTASLDSTILAAGLADKPLCFANLMKSTQQVVATWHVETGGSLNSIGARSTEFTSTLGPAEFAINGDPLLRASAPTGTSTYAWWLYFEFAGAVTSPLGSQTIDAFGLLNHNLNDSSSLTERVDFLVTETAGASPISVRNFTTPFPERMGFDWVDALGTTIYNSVEGVAVRFAGTVISSAWQPAMGEVVCGQRVQLPRKANRPWAEDDIETSLEQLVSDAGQTYTFVKSQGRNVKDYVWNVETAPDDTYTAITFSDQIAAIRNQTRGHAFPLVWVENPATADGDFRFMRAQPPWKAPYVEPGLIQHEMKMQELAPFYRAEQEGW